MPNGRLIKAIEMEKQKFGWEILNKQPPNCASLSMTHNHFWNEIFLPVKKQRGVLKFKQRRKLGKVLAIKRQKEEEMSNIMTSSWNSLYLL